MRYSRGFISVGRWGTLGTPPAQHRYALCKDGTVYSNPIFPSKLGIWPIGRLLLLFQIFQQNFDKESKGIWKPLDLEKHPPTWFTHERFLSVTLSHQQFPKLILLSHTPCTGICSNHFSWLILTCSPKPVTNISFRCLPWGSGGTKKLRTPLGHRASRWWV